MTDSARIGGDLLYAVGRALRQARRTRGLSLRDIAARSGGRFRASSVGSYERGDRRISVERFCELAFFYGVPPDRLLGEALEASAPVGRTRLVVDLTQLSAIDAPEIETLADFLHQVRSQRHDLLSDVISLRSGDLEAMALAAGKEPRVLLSRVRRALRGL